MTGTATNVNRYQPEPVPDGGVDDLKTYIADELARISALLGVLADGHIEKTYAPPAKLLEGMIRFADGTTWNPGSGKGIYYYNGAAWVFLG